jgi:predicted phosphodiesterase
MRLGFLSDAHGNLEAFEVGLRALERLGADDVYFLGDAVGYLPGEQVVEALVDLGIGAVRGNHEAMLLGASRNGGDEAYQLAATAATMTPRLLEAVRGWPRRRWLAATRHPVLLVHGSPADPTFGYVYPDTDLGASARCAGLDGATVFMGNTHRPFVRRFGSTTFVNVGSCGLPRDVGRLGAACMFDDLTCEVTIVRFDIGTATADALRRCGPVHEVVHRVLAREEDSYVGELVAV